VDWIHFLKNIAEKVRLEITECCWKLSNKGGKFEDGDLKMERERERERERKRCIGAYQL
jgi:hypothetical protein